MTLPWFKPEWDVHISLDLSLISLYVIYHNYNAISLFSNITVVSAPQILSYVESESAYRDEILILTLKYSAVPVLMTSI